MLHEFLFYKDASNPMTKIGQGAYGCVYRAQLQKNDGYEMTVAVKTINPDDSDVTYFLALLKEVKIMSSIGKHENVIELIGATTKEIKQRNPKVIVPLFIMHVRINFFFRKIKHGSGILCIWNNNRLFEK